MPNGSSGCAIAPSRSTCICTTAAWSAPGPVEAGVSGRTQVAGAPEAELGGGFRQPGEPGQVLPEGRGILPPLDGLRERASAQAEIVHPRPQPSRVFSRVEQVADEQVDPGESGLGGQLDRLGGRERQAHRPGVEAGVHRFRSVPVSFTRVVSTGPVRSGQAIRTRPACQGQLARWCRADTVRHGRDAISAWSLAALGATWTRLQN